MPAEQSWYLDDAEERARLAPNTFFIPSRDVRHNLKLGDVIKLIFFIRDPEPGGLEAERMWVEVNSTGSGTYLGELLNEPSVIDDLEPGDPVEFEPRHVAAIAVSEADVGYRVDDRAVISRRLAASAFRPGRLQRDEPTHADDSGWVLLVGDETSPGSLTPKDFGATTLGFLTDRFPELEDVFRQGQAGETWEWDETEGRYRRVE